MISINIHTDRDNKHVVRVHESNSSDHNLPTPPHLSQESSSSLFLPDPVNLNMEIKAESLASPFDLSSDGLLKSGRMSLPEPSDDFLNRGSGSQISRVPTPLEGIHQSSRINLPSPLLNENLSEDEERLPTPFRGEGGEGSKSSKKDLPSPGDVLNTGKIAGGEALPNPFHGEQIIDTDLPIPSSIEKSRRRRKK